MLLDEKFDQAEIFLEAATNFYPDCVEAWTVLGLYYDSIGNDIGHEMAIEEAANVNQQLAVDEQRRQMELERAQQVAREIAEATANEITAESAQGELPFFTSLLFKVTVV